MMNDEKTQPNNRKLFIRGTLIGVLVLLVIYATYLGYEYAVASIEHGQPNANVVAIVIAIATPVTALMGYVFKLYKDKEKEKGK